MEKSIIITIMVDNVPIADLETIQEKLDDAFKEYQDKRISTQLVDERLIAPRV